MFGLAAVSLLERRQDDRGPCCDVVASAGQRPPEGPGADVELPVSETFTLAGRGRVLGADDTRVLSACAVQVVAGLPAAAKPSRTTTPPSTRLTSVPAPPVRRHQSARTRTARRRPGGPGRPG